MNSVVKILWSTIVDDKREWNFKEIVEKILRHDRVYIEF